MWCPPIEPPLEQDSVTVPSKSFAVVVLCPSATAASLILKVFCSCVLFYFNNVLTFCLPSFVSRVSCWFALSGVFKVFVCYLLSLPALCCSSHAFIPAFFQCIFQFISNVPQRFKALLCWCLDWKKWLLPYYCSKYYILYLYFSFNSTSLERANATCPLHLGSGWYKSSETSSSFTTDATYSDVFTHSWSLWWSALFFFLSPSILLPIQTACLSAPIIIYNGVTLWDPLMSCKVCKCKVTRALKERFGCRERKR